MFLWICLPLHTHLLAQKVSFIAQAGVSSYGSGSIGGLGTGGGDNSWKTGPIMGIGTRVALTQAFSVGATIEYSTHRYDPGEFGTNYDATNTVLYLNGIGQLRFGLFDPFDGSILGGINLTYQDRDPTGTPGLTELDVGGLLGVGLTAGLSSHVEVFLEGSLRIRTYVTPVAQIGIAYAL